MSQKLYISSQKLNIHWWHYLVVMEEKFTNRICAGHTKFLKGTHFSAYAQTHEKIQVLRM